MSTGSFIWYELMTPDPDAAGKFYGSVLGWKITPRTAPPGEKDYRMILRDDGGSAGGMLRLTADMMQHGARPTWLPYLHVADVDAAVRAIVADGGKVLMPRMDLPVGKVAMVTDPMDTPFYVMTPIPPPDKPEAKSDVFDTKASQRVRWNELASTDLERAKAFYARHFNFRFNEVRSMGRMGDYCFIDHDGVRVGAIMQQRPDASPIPTWQFYFGVDSAAKAHCTIDAGGGKVMHGPDEVPGPMWIIVSADPAGAPFGIVSNRRE
jgi:predicted enzyme related to lactoylglutathione lyase